MTSADAWAQVAPWPNGDADKYEWFSNCYMMRCDDDYCWGGGYLHGPYQPEGKTAETITEDFVTFCLLAQRNSVIPAVWSWRDFLAVASRFVCFAFEKSDAHERWGGENV